MGETFRLGKHLINQITIAHPMIGPRKHIWGCEARPESTALTETPSPDQAENTPL